MDKLTMAHDYMMKHDNGSLSVEVFVFKAWQYADAMQAEAEKRNIDARTLTKDESGNCLHFHHEFGHKKCMDCGASLEEWQPDWSQAPEWAVAWTMDKQEVLWWSDIPSIEKNMWFINGGIWHCGEAPSFDYQGNWKNSLRKRPQ